MNTRSFAVGLIVAAIGVLFGPASAADQAPNPEYRITGPHTHANLTIYLVHGPDRLKGQTYLTLQEALEQKKVIVHETGNVNQLAIENVGDVDVYIQSGEIVKGGKQDRTLGSDLIVSARSGKVPIDSFCVEQGRWRQRGGESAGAFGSAGEMLAGRELKLAAQSSRSQQEVWQHVASEQQKLSENTGRNVRAAASASSYQLTLENTAVKQSSQEYIDKLFPAVKDEDAIGYVAVINGKISSADVYASGALFRKLWPKLLKSSSVEALAELEKGKTYQAPSVDAVQAYLQRAEQGKTQEKQVNARVKVISADSPAAAYFETRDAKQDGQWLHRNYVSKEAE